MYFDVIIYLNTYSLIYSIVSEQAGGEKLGKMA